MEIQLKDGTFTEISQAELLGMIRAEPLLPMRGLVHVPHLPLYSQVHELVMDIEHWREEDPRTGKKTIHVAVVVEDDGTCFVARTRYNPEDVRVYHYDHRFGYEEAVKRALIRCVKYHYSENHYYENRPQFQVNSQLHGRELYRAVREAESGGDWVAVEHTLGG